MITRCTLDDVEPLMADLRLMYAEMAPFGSMADEKCVAFLTDSIKRHVVLKKIDDGKLLGHMGLRFGDSWYSQDLALTEYYCYVKPEYRKTRTAFELYRTAKEIAKEHKLPMFYGTFRHSSADFKRVQKFLERQGGTPVGLTYLIGVE